METDLPVASVKHVTCPGCDTRLDVHRVEPFSVIHCPKCDRRIGVGGKFQHLLVMEALGRGDKAVVYRAYDFEQKRFVALKVAREKLHNPILLGDLRKEARILSQIDDPNVVKLYSFHEVDSHCYLELEYLEGGSVRRKIAHDTIIGLPETHALQIGLEATRGLQAVQRTRHVHGEVSPGNILLDTDGHARLTDLSYAILEGDHAPPGNLGLPGFVAPEALQHHALDHRADIYGLGCTLFYMLTGRPPFEQRIMKASTLLELQKKPPTPDQLGRRVHQPTTELLNMTLQRDRHHRIDDYDQLIGYFEDALWEAQHNPFPRMTLPGYPDVDEETIIHYEGPPIGG